MTNEQAIEILEHNIWDKQKLGEAIEILLDYIQGLETKIEQLEADNYSNNNIINEYIDIDRERRENIEQLETKVKELEEDNSMLKRVNNITDEISVENIERAIRKAEKEVEQEKQSSYWKGYIQKQQEAMEICKKCKYRIKIKELEEREENVKETIKLWIDDKQNEYETVFESYVCQTDEDEQIKRETLSVIKKQKQAFQTVLNLYKKEENNERD